MAQSTLLRQANSVRAKLELKLLFFLILIGLLGFAVIGPVVLLVLGSFDLSGPTKEFEFSWSWWRYALTDRGIIEAVVNTFTVLSLREVTSWPIAILFAWLIARTNMPGSKGLELFFWVAFFLPVLPVIQGWILLLHPSAGLVNVWLAKLPFVDEGPFNLYSLWGIIWMHLVTNSIAIKVILIAPAFRVMDAALEDASRVVGAGALKTLLRITVPVMVPVIGTIMVMSVIRGVQSVEIELILGLPSRFFVFGSKMFNLLRTEPPAFGAASAMGLMMVLVVAPLILLQRWSSTRRTYTTLSSRYQPQKLDLGKAKWLAFAIVLLTGLIITVVPVGLLVMGSFMKLYGWFDVPDGAWTVFHWETVLTDQVFGRSLLNSIYLGLGAATFSTVFFTLVAYVIVRMRSRLRVVLEFLTWLPFILPGIVLAVAWLVLLLALARPIYGTIFALIIVSGFGGITLAVQLVKASLLQLGSELEEASKIAGGGYFTTLFKVVLPLLVPVLVVVWILNFVTAVGSAITPALLATSASRPLALLQLEYVLAGESTPASIVGVLVVLLTVGITLMARAVGFRVGIGRMV